MRGCVGHDVPACGPHRIAEEGLRISLHLVGDDDCEVKRLSYPEEFVEMAVQALLAFAERFSTNMFAAEVLEDDLRELEIP